MTGLRVLAERMRPRLTRREAAIAMISLAVLVLLTVDVLVGGPSTHLDHQIRDAIQLHGDSAPWLLSGLSWAGDLWAAIPLVCAGALVASQYAWRLWPAVFAVSTFAAIELVVWALKAAVGRPGPGIWADRQGYPGYFPSGHAATSTAVVALALFLIGELKLVRLPRGSAVEWCVGIGAIVGVLVGFRAMLGDTHWASDVVGGIALSAAMLVVAMTMCRAWLDDGARTRRPRHQSAP
jgi:membrane-associated phospholipid phosphatase